MVRRGAGVRRHLVEQIPQVSRCYSCLPVVEQERNAEARAAVVTKGMLVTQAKGLLPNGGEGKQKS